jgi:hypothetical protein
MVNVGNWNVKKRFFKGRWLKQIYSKNAADEEYGQTDKIIKERS